MPEPRTPPPVEPPGRGLLTGRRVVVTAAAGTGIGSATARRCLLEGAEVVLSDRHEGRLRETVERLVAETGGRAHAVTCDVTDQGQVDALFAAAGEHLGGLDVVVNNAGLGGTAEVAEMTDAQWHQVIDVTLHGTFRCTRAAIPALRASGGGAIVNNASVLGWRAQAGQAHYAAAKAGVMAFTRCTAVEVADDAIRVNAVAPSLAMHEHLAKVTTDDLLDELTGREAFGRAAAPWEVANVIVFLASDLASYLTGEVIAVSSQRA